MLDRGAPRAVGELRQRLRAGCRPGEASRRSAEPIQGPRPLYPARLERALAAFDAPPLVWYNRYKREPVYKIGIVARGRKGAYSLGK